MPNIITSQSVLPTAKKIGAALAMKRVHRNLRQEDVALKTALSLDTIQRIESGKASIKFESVMKYMAALDAGLPKALADLVAR